MYPPTADSQLEGFGVKVHALIHFLRVNVEFMVGIIEGNGF